MRYLIDTQIAIWFLLDDVKLKKDTCDILTNYRNAIFVSQVSLFEIVIKQKIGKLPELDKPIRELIDLLEKSGFQILPISNAHISTYSDILFIEEHRDPFDRLILATAKSEKTPVISADEKFKFYISEVEIIEA